MNKWRDSSGSQKSHCSRFVAIIQCVPIFVCEYQTMPSVNQSTWAHQFQLKQFVLHWNAISFKHWMSFVVRWHGRRQKFILDLIFNYNCFFFRWMTFRPHLNNVRAIVRSAILSLRCEWAVIFELLLNWKWYETSNCWNRIKSIYGACHQRHQCQWVHAGRTNQCSNEDEREFCIDSIPLSSICLKFKYDAIIRIVRDKVKIGVWQLSFHTR